MSSLTGRPVEKEGEVRVGTPWGWIDGKPDVRSACVASESTRRIGIEPAEPGLVPLNVNSETVCC